MPSSSEKVIEKTLRNTVKKYGGLCLKLPTLHFRGLPDRLVLLPVGICQFVETKSTGDGPSKIQRYVHRKFAKLGFPVRVIDKSEQIIELINELNARRK